MAKMEGKKTKRLIIKPMSDEELEAKMAAETDEHMKQAYAEMLELCRKNPEERIFATNWQISLSDGTPIGGIGFRGAPVNGAVEFGYEIDEAYRNQGYASEAAAAMLEWAFSDERVYFVTAEAEATNAASLKVIEKLGFAPLGPGEEGSRFFKERPASSFMTLFMCCGMCIGMTLGMSVFDNMAIGMSMGMCIGIAIGVSLDEKDKKKRTELRKGLK